MESAEAQEPAGRLIVMAQGACWPSSILRYRDLGPGDAVVAHDSIEALGAFLNRVRMAAADLDALGLAPRALFLCLPDGNDEWADKAEHFARVLATLHSVREVVLTCGNALSDAGELRQLQRAIASSREDLVVRVEASAASRSVRKALPVEPHPVATRL
ncbi:MAG TPA: hypothetical protein VK524_19985, partial [Polyangiaceae bacterium]|nr:hypothetical protein [Polyangiaceae bacterium]